MGQLKLYNMTAYYILKFAAMITISKSLSNINIAQNQEKFKNWIEDFLYFLLIYVLDISQSIITKFITYVKTCNINSRKCMILDHERQTHLFM